MKTSHILMHVLAAASTYEAAGFITHATVPAITITRRSKSQLHLFEVAESLQLFYTTALVAGVGYTQRMAGREDFKKEMAEKIATGEMTPQQLVEEITIMAEEINASANAAVSAQMEVQKLLEETREIQRRLALPSSGESTLTEFNLNVMEEEVKVPVTLISETATEKTNTIPVPLFAVAQVDAVDPEMSMNNKSISAPVDIAYSGQVQVNGDIEKNSFQVIADTIVEEVDHLLEIDHDDTNVIADALLAAPPSIRNKSSESLNESDALELAQKAFASASETSALESQSEAYVIPEPPVAEPLIDLVKESIEIEALADEQPIKNVASDKTTKPDSPIRSSPLARLLCTELGVDLADVYPGSGLKGRVVADDVRQFAAAMQKG